MELSNSTFAEQLQAVLRKYPNLKILLDDNGIQYLKGVLDVPNDNGDIAGHFLVEIHGSEKFPNRFPLLFEVGGEIPNSPDYHKFKDNRCCITVLTDEIVKCQNGITVITFIEKHAIPYLANQIHKKQTDTYKNGEYAHDLSRAIGQYYESLLKTANIVLWLRYSSIAFLNLKVDIGRNDLCFCGSGEKYKVCHLPAFKTLKQIGEERVVSDFKMLLIS